jgi:hypothetical protein
MSYYLVHGLIFELRLEERACEPDKDFLGDLDALISSVVRIQVKRGADLEEVTRLLKKPASAVNLTLGRALGRAWKKRAGESAKLLEEYRTLDASKKKDMLRAKLHRRELKVN